MSDSQLSASERFKHGGVTNGMGTFGVVASRVAEEYEDDARDDGDSEAARSRRSLPPQSRQIRSGEEVTRSTAEEEEAEEEEKEVGEDEEEGEKEGGAPPYALPCPDKDDDIERVCTATCDARVCTVASGRALRLCIS